jgi:hypothetical protein
MPGPTLFSVGPFAPTLSAAAKRRGSSAFEGALSSANIPGVVKSISDLVAAGEAGYDAKLERNRKIAEEAAGLVGGIGYGSSAISQLLGGPAVAGKGQAGGGGGARRGQASQQAPVSVAQMESRAAELHNLAASLQKRELFDKPPSFDQGLRNVPAERLGISPRNVVRPESLTAIATLMRQDPKDPRVRAALDSLGVSRDVTYDELSGLAGAAGTYESELASKLIEERDEERRLLIAGRTLLMKSILGEMGYNADNVDLVAAELAILDDDDAKAAIDQLGRSSLFRHELDKARINAYKVSRVIYDYGQGGKGKGAGGSGGDPKKTRAYINWDMAEQRIKQIENDARGTDGRISYSPYQVKQIEGDPTATTESGRLGLLMESNYWSDVFKREYKYSPEDAPETVDDDPGDPGGTGKDLFSTGWLERPVGDEGSTMRSKIMEGAKAAIVAGKTEEAFVSEYLARIDFPKVVTSNDEEMKVLSSDIGTLFRQVESGATGQPKGQQIETDRERSTREFRAGVRGGLGDLAEAMAGGPPPAERERRKKLVQEIGAKYTPLVKEADRIWDSVRKGFVERPDAVARLKEIQTSMIALESGRSPIYAQYFDKKDPSRRPHTRGRQLEPGVWGPRGAEGLNQVMDFAGREIPNPRGPQHDDFVFKIPGKVDRRFHGSTPRLTAVSGEHGELVRGVVRPGVQQMIDNIERSIAAGR